MDFEFAWDARKAAANIRKHRVSFPEASTVFDDPLAITYPDTQHSTGEARHLTFGMASSGRMLVISHIETHTGLRIISARKADRSERKIYEQG